MSIRQTIKLFQKIQQTKNKYRLNQPAFPYKLALSVTNRCNCHCQVCNVWQIYQKEPTLIKQELDILDYEKFFQNNSPNFLWVAVTGGEPFLRDDFGEILRIVLKNCSNLSLLSIVTNGILTERIVPLAENLFRQYPAVKTYLVVSIDADEEKHEWLRGRKGIYKKIMETLTHLDALTRRYPNLRLRLETTISRFNLEHLDAFLASPLVKKHETTFAFAQESSRYLNLGTGVSLQALAPEAIFKAIKKIQKTAPRRSFEQLLLWLFYCLSYDFFLRPDRQVIPCYSSWASIYLGPWGEIRPCVMMPEAANIKSYDYRLGNLFSTKSWAEIQRQIKTDNCPHCWTPCEAMQTLVSHMPQVFLRAAAGKRL